jgi:hypothetical protein
MLQSRILVSYNLELRVRLLYFYPDLRVRLLYFYPDLRPHCSLVYNTLMKKTTEQISGRSSTSHYCTSSHSIINFCSFVLDFKYVQVQYIPGDKVSIQVCINYEVFFSTDDHRDITWLKISCLYAAKCFQQMLRGIELYMRECPLTLFQLTTNVTSYTELNCICAIVRSCCFTLELHESKQFYWS